MNGTSLVSLTVNAAYQEAISDEEIAELLRRKISPDRRFTEHVYVFFTEVPVSVISTFLKRERVSLRQLQEYYEAYVRPVYQNKELEELFRG